MRLKANGDWQAAALARLFSLVARALLRTLRVTWVNVSAPNQGLKERRGQILCTWHATVLVPITLLRGHGAVVLASPSNDGQMAARYAEDLGLEVILGSTGRFAARAALACVRAVQEGATLAISPDGPKGPARRVQPGCLYFAMKSGAPVYPAGAAAHPAWHLNSWDRFLLPKPFARAVVVFGEPMYVPADASAEELERLASELGARIDELERQAEASLGVRQTTLDSV